MKILIVDDNATNLKLLRDMLEAEGFGVLVTADGVGALALLDREPVDAIISDILLPRMDGYRFCSEVRSNPRFRHLPFIFLTAVLMTPNDEKLARDVGADKVLHEPSTIEVILESLQEAKLRFASMAGSDALLQKEFRTAIIAAQDKKAGAATSTCSDTPPKKLPQPKGLLHVLVAEDQPVNQLLAIRMLEKRGHSVAIANNGREALKVLARETFDLVLMDMQMPEMDGFEATRAIRQQEKTSGNHLPIIALTAYAMKGDREKCLTAGCDDYLAKPITSASLYEMVEKLASVYVRSADPRTPVVTNAPTSAASDVWDRPAALKRVDGDVAFLRELAAMFLENYPNLLADLDTAIQQRDAHAIANAAHTLKGNVGSLVGTAAYEQLLRVEMKAKTGELNEIDGLLPEVHLRLDAFLNRLTKYLAETAADGPPELVLAGADGTGPPT